MLNDEDITWLIAVAKQRLRDVSEPQLGNIIRDRLVEIEKKLEKPVKPLELLIFCPVCKHQHVDEGKFLEPHKRHSCQFCGLLFSVTKDLPNVGVQFFDGCKNGGNHTLALSAEPPTISPPIGHILVPVGYLHAGHTVRFKEVAAGLGYDVSKIYKIESVSAQLSVRLEGDTLPVPYSLLEPVPAS